VSAGSDRAPYLPDHPQMVELFRQHCSLLAVPSEEVPGLQPLLQLLQPPLKALSSSIKQSVTLQDREAEIHPDDGLTQLLQDAAKLAARYIYAKQPQHYMELLNTKQLQQVVGMEAYSAPGLLETLSLSAADGTIRRPQPVGAAVSEIPTADTDTIDRDTDADTGAASAPGSTVKVMLINTADSNGSRCRGIAANLAELLTGSRSGPFEHRYR